MLDDYLDKMLAITFRVEPHISGRTPSCVAELANARANQARPITAYQLYVHRELFEPIMHTGRADQIAAAREMKVECIMLAEDFRAFARQWHIDNVLSEWHVYQPAALALRDRIRSHISHVRKLAGYTGSHVRTTKPATSHF